MKQLKRFAMYGLGILISAFGVTLNTKSGLGVTPFVSVTYAISDIWKLNFGNITFISYVLFCAIQFALLYVQYAFEKQIPKHVFRSRLILVLFQIPYSIIFTRLLNAFEVVLPDVVTDLHWGIVGQIVTVLVAIIVTGIGASMTLSMRLSPNPADALVQTTADTLHTGLGITKNVFDVVNVLITSSIGLLSVGEIRGIGLGTVLAVIGLGRVFAWYQHHIAPRFLYLVEE